MKQALTTFFTNLFTSGHSFEKNEVLLKFQYRVINTILMVMGFFTFIFATLSLLGMNPLGLIQTVVNYLLVMGSIYLVFSLRGPKENYIKNAYYMYVIAFLDFVSALLFVPHDEFRIIWFYLLVFAAYITGGLRAGNIVSVVSIITVFSANIFYDLQLSETAIVSSLLGLVIATLFFRSYTKKIIGFEQEITAQQDKLTRFNEELEKKVIQKTQELQELNASLETKVAQKVAQITKQERLMISQSRLATMGEMMSMIAHQWRQPLSTTTLLITNERMKSVLAGEEASENDKILDRISETMIYLSDTIDDFQTYFKPDKKTETVGIMTLIERAQSFLETRLKLAKTTVEISQIESEPIETYANEVVQVLINILNNAIDVLEEKKNEDRCVWIGLTVEAKDISIIIEDNAGGIDGEIIDRVFEPYFSQKSKNGTGLGLYMAKMIIESHMNG
ncbi:MAG: GHKL domain-containing protein, partial [Sulfurovum sp.]|uniref:sensor histidine kinase n=1 Tax=Sulfurovum sp. TaxID=1969726 RepID=UPI002867F77C